MTPTLDPHRRNDFWNWTSGLVSSLATEHLSPATRPPCPLLEPVLEQVDSSWSTCEPVEPKSFWPSCQLFSWPTRILSALTLTDVPWRRKNALRCGRSSSPLPRTWLQAPQLSILPPESEPTCWAVCVQFLWQSAPSGQLEHIDVKRLRQVLPGGLRDLPFFMSSLNLSSMARHCLRILGSRSPPVLSLQLTRHS